MTRIIRYISGMFFLLILATSCNNSKELIYFQGGSTDSSARQNANYTPVFKADDFLAIQVTGDDPEAALLFNPPVLNTNSGNSGYSTGTPSLQGYLIDAAGNINFPIIGVVHLAGLNRMEATALLQQRIGEYLKNPVITMQIQNYKITVLGDVKNPGTYKIPNERITVLEAIGLAGDLKMTGRRKNILVIRDENGIKTEYRLDITSTAIFNSPAYYLAQNDVVYVEPNKTAQTDSKWWKATGSIVISLTSLVVTTISVITR